MDFSGSLYVISGLFFVIIIFLSGFCSFCYGHKQPMSISQRSTDSSPEYIPDIVIRHPSSTYVPHAEHYRTGNISYHLNHSLSSPSFNDMKVSSCPPSETESQASYVNQSECEEEARAPPQEEADNYIIVIPDSPNTGSRRPSRASSQSSGENYINIGHESTSNTEDSSAVCADAEEEEEVEEEEEDSDEADYENLKTEELQNPTFAVSSGSVNSNDDNPDYVNTMLDCKE